MINQLYNEHKDFMDNFKSCLTARDIAFEALECIDSYLSDCDEAPTYDFETAVCNISGIVIFARHLIISNQAAMNKELKRRLEDDNH